MTRILGIDPGSRITGFGIVEVAGRKTAYIESGCVRVEAKELPARLGEIFAAIGEIIVRYAPQQVAIERVFMHRNADSALKLGQARGAAICAAVSKGLPVSEYTPSEIKQAMVGKGNAAKVQVQHMVQALLGLPGMPSPDAADALAVAMCHLHIGQTLAGSGLPARGLRR